MEIDYAFAGSSISSKLLQFTSATKRRKVETVRRKEWNPLTKRRKSNIPLLKVHFHQNCYNLHRILNSGKWNLFGGICGIRILNGGNRLFLCWKFSSLFPFNLLQFTSDTKRRKVDPIWRKMWNPRTKRRKSNIPLLEVHFHPNSYNLHRILNGGKWKLFGGKSGIRILNGGNRLFLYWKFIFIQIYIGY